MKTILPTLALLLAGAQLALSDQKPNILILLSDDQGYADLSIQGAKDIPTPHIDSIGKNGVRFTAGYVSSPMCSPSRAGFMTGRSQSRFGHDVNWHPEWPVDPNDTRGLPLTEKTMGDQLKAAGYHTGIFGKWHLGEAPHFHPNRRGFDEFFGFVSGGHLYYGQSYRDTPPVHHYNTLLERNGEPQPAKPGYLTTVLGKECADFIHRNKEIPWLLFASFNAPHTPMQATPELLERIKDIEDEQHRTYAAMVLGMDDAIGRILKQLRDDGLEDNTLIFFLSDNGGTTEENPGSNAPLLGRKGTMYEGGIRVPFLAQWKGVLPAGKIYHRPVSSLDVIPTALAAAGGNSIADEPLDGVDLVPYLTGEKSGDPHEALFWRISERNIWAIRSGDHKLVKQGNKVALYDLAKDKSETKNLVGELPEVQERLQASFDEWEATLVEPRWRIYKTPEIEAAEAERRRRNKEEREKQKAASSETGSK